MRDEEQIEEWILCNILVLSEIYVEDSYLVNIQRKYISSNFRLGSLAGIFLHLFPVLT